MGIAPRMPRYVSDATVWYCPLGVFNVLCLSAVSAARGLMPLRCHTPFKENVFGGTCRRISDAVVCP